MSIRKIRKAGQKKAFMAATYCGSSCFMYHKQYGKQRFPKIKLRHEYGSRMHWDNWQRGKKGYQNVLSLD